MTRDQVRRALERTGRPVSIGPGVLDLPDPSPEREGQALPVFIPKNARGPDAPPGSPHITSRDQIPKAVFGLTYPGLTSAEVPHWVILQHHVERAPRQHIRAHLIARGEEVLVAYYFRKLEPSENSLTLICSELDFGSVRAIQSVIPRWCTWSDTTLELEE